VSRAIAIQTFHHSGGTVFAGQEFDADDPFVDQFAPMFSVPEETPKTPPTKKYDDGYEEQSLGVLRNLAKQRKLDSSGTKEELVKRLRESDDE
jgi:SAP domain